MPSGLESLHKILKDEKRRRILTLVNEKGPLSYTDIMTALEISSTGKLNYHLKILSELLTKNLDGLYTLTEKGRLAVSLLKAFGERKSPAQVEAAPAPRGYFIAVGLFTVASVCFDFAFYLLNQISFNSFMMNLALAGLAVVFLVGAERARAKRLLWQPNRQRLGAMFSIIFAGAFAGAVLLFFVGGFVLFGLTPEAVRGLFPTFNAWIAASFAVGGVFGGLAGYAVYRKSRYSKAAYYEPV